MTIVIFHGVVNILSKAMVIIVGLTFTKRLTDLVFKSSIGNKLHKINLKLLTRYFVNHACTKDLKL